MKNENESQKQSNSDLKSSRSNRSTIRWLSKLKKDKKSNFKSAKVSFNLDGLGDIELAKLHREANRPLNKIKDFDKNTKFCPCCSLPVEQKGYIERFNFWDNTDKFSECGRGISLYFSYFRFAILISAISFIIITIPTFYMTYNYTNGLKNVCNIIHTEGKYRINETFPECINFIINENTGKRIIDEEWLLKYNSINLKEYRHLHSHIINSYENIDRTLFNYSIIYFIGLISLFLINISYIILLYNKNKEYDILVTSPSDFTVIVTNLHSAFKIFWKKINKINYIIKTRNKNEIDNTSKSTESKQRNKEIQLKEELGLNFPQNQEIDINEAFHQFIKNKLCENSKGYNFQINHINICYKIGEYMRIEEKIQDRKKKIIMATYDPKQQIKNENLDINNKKYFIPPFTIFGINLFCCDSCKKSILLSEIQEEKLKLEKQLEELIKFTGKLTEEDFAGVIFITFETMDEQEKFLEPYPKSFIMYLLIKIKDLKYYLCKCAISKEKQKRFLLKRNLEVYVAPEPDDVIFENLQFSSFDKSIRMFLTYFLSFIIIGICFVIILIINYLQIKYMKNSSFNKNVVKYGLSMLITGVISLINIMFQICLGYLTKIEKLTSLTEYHLSFSVKLTIFTFITSAIVPLISDYNINSEKNYNLLVTNMMTYFISNSILTPLFWTFNLYHLYKKIIICLIEKKQKHNLTQRELNSLYELPGMQIAYKYSYIVRTLLMSFFYMPIFPLSSFMSLSGFLLGYFLEKFNFTNLYKRPEMLNSKICEFYSKYLFVNYFMLGLGEFVFLRDEEKDNKWNFINIMVFGILIIIPYNEIFNFDFIGINESDLKQEKYEDIYFTFYNDYERANPMTKKEGMKRFINKLKEKNFLQENEYNEIQKNIENINLMEVYYESKKYSRENTIKSSYRRQDTIRKKTNKNSYISNFNNFIKHNKEYVLNYLLSLGKKQNNANKNTNNKISVQIIEEKNSEKSEHNNNEINKIKNIGNDENYEKKIEIKTDIISEQLTSRNNNYRESEQKINLVNNDSISFPKINNKNKKYDNCNCDRKNNFKENYIFTTNKDNNEDLINYNENENIYGLKHNQLNNNNDIEIYNKYKNRKKEDKMLHFKKYTNNILTQNDLNKNNIEIYNKRPYRNSYAIKLDINNKNDGCYNKDVLPLFSQEHYDELHKRILSQYKNSSDSNINLNSFIKLKSQINRHKNQKYENYNEVKTHNFDNI